VLVHECEDVLRSEVCFAPTTVLRPIADLRWASRVLDHSFLCISPPGHPSSFRIIPASSRTNMEWTFADRLTRWSAGTSDIYLSHLTYDFERVLFGPSILWRDLIHACPGDSTVAANATSGG
jgi:hypothetical protein